MPDLGAPSWRGESSTWLRVFGHRPTVADHCDVVPRQAGLCTISGVCYDDLYDHTNEMYLNIFIESQHALVKAKAKGIHAWFYRYTDASAYPYPSRVQAAATRLMLFSLHSAVVSLDLPSTSHCPSMASVYLFATSLSRLIITGAFAAVASD